MTMQDYQTMRQAMVASQLRTNAVTDRRLIAAISTVERERFVPPEREAIAYVDRPVPLGAARALNPPMTIGLLIQECGLRASDKVLLVGAATGYTAALLARLVASVTALECDGALLDRARTALADAPNVTLVQGPLESGWPGAAPYDVIMIDGAVEHVPTAIIDQLVEGGRLGTGLDDDGVQRLAVGRKVNGGFGLRAFADAESVRLPGFAKPAGFRF